MARHLVSVLTACCLAGAVLAAGAVAAAPNGIEVNPTDDIVAAALKAGSGARSVWVHGGGTSSGKKIALDIHIGPRGGKGHIDASGLSFDFIRVGSTAYFRGGLAFWRKAAGPSGATLAPLFANKWMRVSAAGKSPLAPLVALTDQKQLLRDVLTGHAAGALSNSGLTSFAGLPVVAVKDTADGGTLYVASTGRPYPLGIVAGDSGSSGTIRFEQWDKPLAVKAPKASVDLTRYVK